MANSAIGFIAKAAIGLATGRESLINDTIKVKRMIKIVLHEPPHFRMREIQES